MRRVPRPRFEGLWRHADFRRLWAGATVSIFGSLITRTALPFTAILVLDATPARISLLRLAELVPAFVVGLVAGVWVDRVRLRPLMIAMDVARAVLLVSIPLAALVDALTFAQLYVVAATTGVLTTFFDVAYQSYLPTLVRREELVEGNSKLAATGSVAEVAAFGSGGWLVQALTAPVAILIDALTFVVSALFLARIRAPEPAPGPAGERESAVREAAAGLRLVAGDPVLRALAGSTATLTLGAGVFGSLFLLYVTDGLDLSPGLQGLIYAVGGGTSLVGALVAAPLTRRFGVGPSLIGALVVAAVGQLLVPLAGSIPLTAGVVAFMVAQQFITDPAQTLLGITHVSLVQAITPARLQGRVNATMRFVEFGGLLLGTVVAGLLGETIGVRSTLFLGIAIAASAALWPLLSPVRHLREAPVAPVDDLVNVVPLDR